MIVIRYYLLTDMLEYSYSVVRFVTELLVHGAGDPEPRPEVQGEYS